MVNGFFTASTVTGISLVLLGWMPPLDFIYLILIFFVVIKVFGIDKLTYPLGGH